MAITLSKGGSLSLKKSDGSSLTQVRLGLGWDAAKGGRSVDLDASALLLDSSGKPVSVVSFMRLKSKDGSVRHSGDNLTGRGDGDDEQISVDLTKVSANVEHIVFVITSFSGQKFSAVENVYARVVDTTDGENEVVRYNLAESRENTANVIAKISRDGAGWSFTAIGEFTNGRTAKKTLPTALQHL